jgi:hypothetical protein
MTIQHHDNKLTACPRKEKQKEKVGGRMKRVLIVTAGKSKKVNGAKIGKAVGLVGTWSVLIIPLSKCTTKRAINFPRSGIS